MVGISITSAPISRRGAARPRDCLLARVVRMRQPLSGSSCFTPAAFFAPVDDLLALMAALELPLPAHTRRSGFYLRRASTVFALSRGPASLHHFLPTVPAKFCCRPGVPPWHEEPDHYRASQHTLLWVPGNLRPWIPAARVHMRWLHAYRHHSGTPAALWSVDRHGEFQSPVLPALLQDTSHQAQCASAHACPVPG